jgi:hypothetical protein
MTDVSLDGRLFRPVENHDGEVGGSTTFEYHDSSVWNQTHTPDGDGPLVRE